MSILSIPPLIMTGVTAYVSLYHLMIRLRQRQHRQNLTFALLSLSVSLHAIFSAGLYNATSVGDGVQWQRRRVFTLALLTMAFLWFAADTTTRLHKRGLYLFSAFFSLAAVAQVVIRNDLTWDVSQPSIKQFVVPLLDLSIGESRVAERRARQVPTGAKRKQVGRFAYIGIRGRRLCRARPPTQRRG